MKASPLDMSFYLTPDSRDLDWDITITTVGYQHVPPKGRYPLSKHPDAYEFNPAKGRVLDEYQLVFITKGGGFFMSKSCPKRRVSAGSILILFPGEWHDYYPDPETGWNERWVGFKGVNIDKRVERGFFSKSNPVIKTGFDSTLLNLHDEIMQYALEEKDGYQQIGAGIVLNILGIIYFVQKHADMPNGYTERKIKEAKEIMKKRVDENLTPEEVASIVGLGYSCFRRNFKLHIGTTPAQYQIQLRLIRAKELLLNTYMSMSEIAYALRFENSSQFSTFFKKREGITPSEFRQTARQTNKSNDSTT
jgi:AraC-like DNA-binding protein